MKQILILGAGISGLTLGWLLKQRHGNNIKLTILEKNHRAGGWIQTINHEGFLFEQGPRSCRPGGTGVATLKLIKELGLEKEVILAAPAAKKRYLYYRKQLHQLPTNPFSMLFSPLMKGVVSALLHEWQTPPSNQEDETIYSFISRRLSPDIAERLMDPLTSGIYAGDIRQLSIRSCFPLLHQWEQNHGSLLKGMWKSKKSKQGSIFSLRRGMETLTQTLAQKLDSHLILNCEVSGIEASSDKILVSTVDGRQWEADHLYAAIPSQQAYQLGMIKTAIPATSVAVVNMGWKKNVLKKEGFGYLIPSSEKEEILGTVWDSSTFPQQNHSTQETRMTVMIGGTHMKDFNEKKFDEIALRSLNTHLNITTPPDAINIKIAKKSIPQYQLGHLQKVDDIQREIRAFSNRVTLLGNSYYGVSVNDCINEATKILST